MKSLFAAVAVASVVLPGAAFAADMEKCCCCEKMEQKGADCCDKDNKDSKGDTADHSDHTGQTDHQADAPAK